MPHCGGAYSCNCVVTGDGVSGSGTLSDPYVITSVPEGGGGEPSAAALLDLPTADSLLRMAQLRAGQDLLITAVGDSETAGTSLSGGGYDTSWPARLATLLGPVVGRWYEYGQQTATDSLKWTLTNTSGTSGPGAEGILLIRPGDYVTITTPVATTLKVRYANSGFVGALAGNLQVTIDGTVVTTITPNGSASQATWTSGTLSNATHTMVLRNTHATAVAWCVAVYAGTAGTGITLNNAGLSGSSTDTWQATHHLSVWAHAARETSAVGIAFLSLGVNDAGLGIPVATYKTRLTTLAQRMRGIWAATIIVIQPQPSGVPWATWLTYTEAAREVADEQGCGIVDITQRWGPHDGTWGSTRLYSDVTHPSALGYRDIAAAIYHHLDAIPNGGSSASTAWADITGKPSTFTPATHAATHAAAGSDPVTLTSAQISDLTETVQDIVGAFLVAGTNVTVTYNDTANTFTLNATAGGGGTTDPEIVRDVIGAAMVAGSGVQITVNDAGDTITVASTAVLPTRQVNAGTGLTGGGDLSADRTLSVAYGTTAGTTAQGNDARITGAAQKSANLSDLANAATARTNLGLDDSAVIGALPIPDPGSYYPTDTITAALQLIGDRERYGTGSPEGVLTAPVGTYYTDTAITNGAMRWAKKTGTGNTGWEVLDGDTGWRSLTLSANFSGGSLWIRRIGERIYLRLLATLATDPGWSAPFAMPASWAPPSTFFAPVVGVTSATLAAWLYIGGESRAGYAYYRVTGGGFPIEVSCVTSWPVDSAWPTTLPGTPA